MNLIFPGQEHIQISHCQNMPLPVSIALGINTTETLNYKKNIWHSHNTGHTTRNKLDKRTNIKRKNAHLYVIMHDIKNTGL
ncbi:hypothetical protein SAMN05660284_00674 [Formivibrio citricus]|uniref:Uncharacterized protein n=1 Tax=Formivibrio citricus TaxID=83765 RepID=A0A1I4WKE8_9NEIS|nr:hypothetical protein SAMN05660284_00674 [Formivibrio citricus]